MSKSVYDGLSADAKKAISDVGESMQESGLARPRRTTSRSAGIYIKPVSRSDMDSAAIDRCARSPRREAWTGLRRPQRRLRALPQARPTVSAA